MSHVMYHVSRVTCQMSCVMCHMSSVTKKNLSFLEKVVKLVGGGSDIKGATFLHIVPCGKFHRIGGAPPKTFPNVKYDAPEEVGGDRKCFDSPIRK